MTDLLYQSDSYMRRFEAHVVQVDADEGAIALDRTAFYPGGGGQPCDTGWIEINSSRSTVQGVKRIEEHVWHWLTGGMGQVGTPIRGEIDWERRYALMRTHTALHVLCGVVWRAYGAKVTGGNMEPLKGRMDFEFESLRRELVQEIEEKVNEEIAKDHPVRVRILPREEAFQIPDLIRTKINLLPEGITRVRVVEIGELDLQADGGTHVAKTSEIGTVRIVDYKSKGRINKRLEIAVEP